MAIIRTPIPKDCQEFQVDVSDHPMEYLRQNFSPGRLFEYEGCLFRVLELRDDGVMVAARGRA